MIDKNALYVMTFPDGTQNLVLDVQKWWDGSLAFHDTCRGHNIAGRIKETSEGVEVTTKQGATIKFKLVTIEAFRRKYKDIANAGDAIAEVCNTTADLWEYYRRRLREDFR